MADRTLCKTGLMLRAFVVLGIVTVGIAGGSRDSRSDDCSSYEGRPFGERAPWNVPVASLATHPESREYVRRLWEGGSDRPGNFNLRFDSYTYPVYHARNATGFVRVATQWEANIDKQEIPWNPKWRPAQGSDAQLIILDPETGREWDLFQVSFDDEVLSATHGNLVPGDYRTREVGFKPSRGAGIPYLAMLVRGQEILQGRIPHALGLPVRDTDGFSFWPPATKLEFPGRMKNGIPEGIRFALKATDTEIEQWLDNLPREVPEAMRNSARVIATALREFGWFVVDTSGAAGFQFESRLTAEVCWKAAGLSEIEIDDKVYPRDLLDGLLVPDRIVTVVPSNEYPDALRARP